MPVRPLPGYPDEIPKRRDGYTFNDFNYSPLGYLNTKYMWNTWGDNCTICNALRGKVYTLDFWANCGLWPGFHVGCDCTMKKVDDATPISDLDFFGMNVLQYADMWMPIPNIFWDPTYKIQPYQMDIISQIEQMHLLNGSDMPFSEMIKNLHPGFFSKRVSSVIGDTVGWRVLATRREYENIDGSWGGDKLFTFEHLRYALEPLFEWFYPKWLRKSHTDLNAKYAANKRLGVPCSTLQPAALRPWQPFQTYYTEVE